jgi:hypothetical protein
MTTSSDWRFVALLHNLQLEEPVRNDYMAVVPVHDSRLVPYTSDQNFSHFVHSFTDQFERTRLPSALMARGRVRRKPEAVTAFRNALAICSVINAWERFIAHHSQLQYFKYSGYFDLYPYSPGKDFTYLVINTASVLGLDETKEFCGLTTPELVTGKAQGMFYDEPLFRALLRRWSDCHVAGRRDNPHNDALFNSLEMAYRAARMPHDNRGSLSDCGAQIGLWVSAFETLAWARHGHATLTYVLETLQPAAQHLRRLRRRYVAPYPGKPRRRALPVAEKLYCEMYKASNDFLHGNPVTRRNLYPSGSAARLPLSCFAPILYKCALLTALELWRTDPREMRQEVIWRIRMSALSEALLASTRRWHRHPPDSRRRVTAQKRAPRAQGV